ncbi:cytochrome d ubiquinol oxidase subunit II [Georgenia sp. Z1344]|uniref:cytochrome d ubiquinol oxidase subunit II n=1 Tax=Georgenia sp. Z1344 TaxID=3416706 RepID=UPI003CF240A9
MTEALPLLWFVLIAVLWTGYLMLEGFDFGVGMLLTILPRGDAERRDKERRTMLSSIGPHWDGNEVWLITAGGAMFAAFPEWYATMFSGMYLPLLVILVALIVRICAIEWRGKVTDPAWRRRWDLLHTISAWVPAVLWGVAFANLVQGMEIVRDDAGNAQLTGGLLSLLTPFTLLGGLLTAVLFLAHGMVFLAWKTAGTVHDQAVAAAKPLSLIALVVGAAWGLWAQLAHSAHVWTWAPLVVAAVGLVGAAFFAHREQEGRSFVCSAVTIVAAVVLIFGAMAPDVMRSSVDPAYSLTFREAAATGPTLVVMSIVALVLVPVVLAYQAWSYWVFRRRINADVLPDTPAGLDRRVTVPVRVAARSDRGDAGSDDGSDAGSDDDGAPTA